VNAPAVRVSKLDKERLRELAASLFCELQNHTTDSPGVTRECYAEGEEKALQLFRDIAESFGLKCTTDRAANLIIALPDDDFSKPALVLGSHADSVPHGGNFDGGAGLVAALLALIRLHQAKRPLQTPVRVLAMRGEESAYYGRANIGSRALFGLLNPADLKAKRQGTGQTLKEAMAGAGADVVAIEEGARLLPLNFATAYLELHIEQGPVMVARDLPTAIVTGIRGNLRHRRVICRGEAGHSGTVPRWLRHDAVFATSDLLMRLDEHWNRLLERGLDLVVTAGVFSTDPERQAISRIPGEVFFSFEVRSQSFETLEGFYELFRSECRAVSDQRRVTFEFDERIYTEPARMNETIIERLVTTSEQLGYTTEAIPSGAGHDAAVFANAGVPSGMIFVRNKYGSHNPEESMEIEDFLKGAELMYEFARKGLQP
jgi:beta-ureidopropionase / N-carbamoyl-L-amino-acid hydrolase